MYFYIYIRKKFNHMYQKYYQKYIKHVNNIIRNI